MMCMVFAFLAQGDLAGCVGEAVGDLLYDLRESCVRTELMKKLVRLEEGSIGPEIEWMPLFMVMPRGRCTASTCVGPRQM